MTMRLIAGIAITIALVQPVAAEEQPDTISTSVEIRNQGMLVNGFAYYDPIGEIVSASKVNETGFVTYLARDPNGQQVIKTISANNADEVTELGALETDNDISVFVHAGERYTYNSMRLVSKGVILENDHEIRYVSPDSKQTSIKIPDGFSVSEVQQDDLSLTKHLLLASANPNDPTTTFMLLDIVSGKFTLPFKMKTMHSIADAPLKPSSSPVKNNTTTSAPAEIQVTYQESPSEVAPVSVYYDNGYARVVLKNLLSNHF